MTTDEILCALDALAVQTGSLACLGCGHEHNCGIHGCAIIREAGKIIRWLSTDNTALRYAIKPAKVKRSQEQNFNGAVAYLRALIEEQRAQIEKAEAENAVLREKVPQWISVEDRLPEVWINEEDDVLVNYMIYSQDFGVDIGNYHAKAKRWVCMGLPCSVTHWMPLPEAPEEGGKHE